MPRKSEHTAAELGSRKSRQRLPVRLNNAYYTHMQDGLSLGYRRGKRGGTWIARTHDQEHGYRFSSLGTANDLAENVGMSYDAAQKAAKAWFEGLAHLDAGEASAGPYTVERVMVDYLSNRQKAKRKPLKDMQSIINAHILPTLGSIDVAKLTFSKIERWRDALADSDPKVRVKAGAAPATRKIDSDDSEVMRKRYATANRIFTVLRAALNFAYKRGKVSTRAAWERVAPFASVDAPKVRHLTLAECKRLTVACPADFRQLVHAALYTGCRYGELIAMRVDAFDGASHSLHVAESKSGKSRFVPLSDEGSAFFQSVIGKRDKGLLFLHADGAKATEERGWEASQQRHWMLKACEKAEIAPAISFHILRHTYASHLAMNNTELGAIRDALGHADTRMTERHYAHLSQSHLSKVIRANLPSFASDIDPQTLSTATH
jgi:integrase